MDGALSSAYFLDFGRTLVNFFQEIVISDISQNNLTVFTKLLRVPAEISVLFTLSF
jgi:hypothetical protein